MHFCWQGLAQGEQEKKHASPLCVRPVSPCEGWLVLEQTIEKWLCLALVDFSGDPLGFSMTILFPKQNSFPILFKKGMNICLVPTMCWA